MKCKKCYMPIETTDKVCPFCGEIRFRVNTFAIILLAVFSVLIGSFLMFLTAYSTIPFITDFILVNEYVLEDSPPNELQNTTIDFEMI